MKFILCFSLLFVLVASVEITPKTLTREIKADVLRGIMVYGNACVSVVNIFHSKIPDKTRKRLKKDES